MKICPSISLIKPYKKCNECVKKEDTYLDQQLFQELLVRSLVLSHLLSHLCLEFGSQSLDDLVHLSHFLDSRGVLLL